MSGASAVEQQAEEPTTLDEVVAELQELRGRVDELESDKQELRDEREKLNERVTELEDKNQALKDEINELEALNKSLKTKTELINPLATLVTGDAYVEPDDIDDMLDDFPYGIVRAARLVGPVTKLLIGEGHDDSTETVLRDLYQNQGPWNRQLAEVSNLDSNIKSELQDYTDRKVGSLQGRHTSLIREIAEETGVELTEVRTGDMISRVITDGIDAVENSPSKRQRRAEIVLQNIHDWSTKMTIRAGPVYKLERPKVQRLLNATDDVSITLTSKTTGDVFDAIEKLAEATPRAIKRRQEDGSDVLFLGRSKQDQQGGE